MSLSYQPFRANVHQFLYAEKMRKLVQTLETFPELSRECLQLRQNIEGIVKPFEIAIFGRMKTGKSSILNALFGRHLAITGVNETTATINRLCYGTGRQQDWVDVHWLDGKTESIPFEELHNNWIGTSDEVTQKATNTDYLELYADADLLKSVTIIDTPGTDSANAKHEQIAQQFIEGRETDALIYVFSPLGRETDLNNLQTFRAKSCLPSSDPYNSVALMHRWDELYRDANFNMGVVHDKARQLETHMKGLVACVLPVSAPLAFVAKQANAAFWTKCAQVLRGYKDKDLFIRALKRLQRNADLKELYDQAKQMYHMPMEPFQVMMYHLSQLSTCTPQNCANTILHLSGFPKLMEMLNSRFLRFAGQIRQRQTRARVLQDLNIVYTKLGELLKSYKDDFRHFKTLSDSSTIEVPRSWIAIKAYSLELQIEKIKTQKQLDNRVNLNELMKELSLFRKIEENINDKKIKHWSSNKAFQLKKKIEQIEQVWKNVDGDKIAIETVEKLLDGGAEAKKWLETGQSYFTTEETELLHSCIDIAAGFYFSQFAPDNETALEKIGIMDSKLALLAQSYDITIKNHAKHMRDNLLVAAKQIQQLGFSGIIRQIARQEKRMAKQNTTTQISLCLILIVAAIICFALYCFL